MNVRRAKDKQKGTAFGRCQPSGLTCGITIDDDLVDTVTVNAPAAPLSVIEDGETVQVASDGAPLQLSATAPLKPFIGVTWRL
jgi:hypothetical protein